MNILAIDQGTRSGFALLENGSVESGTVVFDVKRGESPGCRYIRFNRWLEDVATHPPSLSVSSRKRDARVSLVVYEQAHYRGGAATEIANGFTTRIQEFCARYGIEHQSVHSATLKKFATGSGRGDKAAMLVAAREKWNRPDLTDDNEADALWLLEYVRREVIGEAA